MSEHYWNYCAMDSHFEHGGLSATYGDLIEALHDAYERNDELEADAQYGRETNEYCQQAAEISNKALAAKDAEITELKASKEALMQRTRKLENQPANSSWEELAAKDRIITNLNEDRTDLRERLAAANANCRAVTNELAHLLAVKDKEIVALKFKEQPKPERRCENCNAVRKDGRCHRGPPEWVTEDGVIGGHWTWPVVFVHGGCRDGFEPREHS